MPASPLRSMRGPASRYRSGSHVCQRCDGSTTWSSTLTIIGIVGVAVVALTRPSFGSDTNLTGRHMLPRGRKFGVGSQSSRGGVVAHLHQELPGVLPREEHVERTWRVLEAFDDLLTRRELP